ncbi:carboxy terminal-processing peptidase [Woeseiaceae bacterium]|nr:carboxy terminal-processing peptidase [Woeseiaceae bacterium]
MKQKIQILNIKYYLFLLLIGFSSAFSNTEEIKDEDSLIKIELKHEKVSALIERLIERSHYNHTKVDDALSSQILDNYIENLDGNRSYFIASDIEIFESYRFKIDDMLGPDSLQPVFEIFDTYRTKAISRMEFALASLDNKPDFLIDEDYQFDRSEEPWVTSINDLDELWRKRVKNDVLNLVLNEKEWPETKDLLTKRYERFLKQLKQLNKDDIFETFMNSVVHSLDPHSSYFSPRNSEEYQIQMSLSYFGIGASLSIEDDYVSIVNIIPGGPASIDGNLKPKDRISAIAQGVDGDLIDVIGWRLDDVVQLIRGPVDTVVRLQILPDGSVPGEIEHIINLTRDQVKLEESAAKSDIIKTKKNGKDYSIGVIDVPSFYRDYKALNNGDEEFTSTTSDVKRLISELKETSIDALIIDLRNNGGGHLTEATALSGLFVDNGPIVQLQNARGRISRLDDPDPVPRSIYEGPLIVLVNRYSASASEIFAAAIQDYGRGIIVGQQTFGKGTVQNLYPLDQYVRKSDDQGLGQLTLTIGKYYRVTGESTQNRGVAPDIELPSYIDISSTGESARKTALPWDTIRSSSFKKIKSLGNTIEVLSIGHEIRKTEDPHLIFLIEDIEAANKNRIKKSISLNANKRTEDREKDIDDRKKREEKRNLTIKPNNTNGLDANNSDPVSLVSSDKSNLNNKNNDEDINDDIDIHLNEAAAIATDFLTLNDLEGITLTNR